MVAPDAPLTASEAVARNASSPGPSSARTRPGLVQNWPAPSVSDATKARPISSARADSAPGKKDPRFVAALSGIAGDRRGPPRRVFHRRGPAEAGAGEADRLDAPVC